MVGRSALRGSDRHNNLDSMAGRLPRRKSRMAEAADSISGGARPRGSDSDSNMNSTVGGSALRGSDRHSDINSMAGRLPRGRSCMAEDARSMSAREELGPERGPELGSRIRSDMDSSVARGAPRRGVGGQIKADLLESTDDGDLGWLATDPGAGLRKDASMSLDRQRDRYLIISQKNVVPYVGGGVL